MYGTFEGVGRVEPKASQRPPKTLMFGLFHSKVRVQIIIFLVKDFSESFIANEFSVNQLAQRVGCSKSSISRRIHSMVQEGLVIISPERNALKTRLNPSHPLIIKLLELEVLHGRDRALFDMNPEAIRKLQELRTKLESERRRTTNLHRQLEHIRELRSSSVSEFSSRLVQQVIIVLKEEGFGSEEELRDQLVPLVAEELRAEFPFLWRE